METATHKAPPNRKGWIALGAGLSIPVIAIVIFHHWSAIPFVGLAAIILMQTSLLVVVFGFLSMLRRTPKKTGILDRETPIESGRSMGKEDERCSIMLKNLQVVRERTLSLLQAIYICSSPEE